MFRNGFNNKMPKDLAKVQKKIHKKKGVATSLHENSRDAKRLRRAGARSDKLEKLATARGKALQPYLRRISFFQSAAQEASGPFTVESMQALIEIYLDRDSTELSTIQSERRPGRPTSTGEDLLKQRIQVEANEYKSGYWIPDMEDMENLERLKEWNEQWTSLGTLEYVRIAKHGTKHVSSFPPKGKS
ncbi:MAG: hypothetical protein L6R38_001341 [Xanthoria sp. 2 TBL-2021]|nr:MAG: hypothetical protein L6R38_001341 [Xanthoria sp. 2 TBL-2021]